MNLLLYKITIAPVLVALATLAGRRWGDIAAGLVAGMPIVAGPVLFFFAVEQGPVYATEASVATLLGILSLCAFVLAYGWRAWTGGSVLSSLLLGWVAFAVLTLLIQNLMDSHSAGLLQAFGFALVGLFLSLQSLPPETALPEADPDPGFGLSQKVNSKTRPPAVEVRVSYDDPAILNIPPTAVLADLTQASAPKVSGLAKSPQPADASHSAPGASLRNPPLPPKTPGPLDLPLRMVSAALLVWALTAFAERLGPRLGGLLTPFPVASTVLAVFAHRQGGSEAVRAVLKGLLLALNAFAVFCAVLGVALVSWGILPSFGVALLACCLTQAAVIAARSKARRA